MEKEDIMPTKRILYALAAILLTACSKDERLVYHDPAAVYFFTDSLIYQTDSLTYSFAIHDSQLQQDTVKIPLKIIGAATGADRKVSVEAVADSTTAKEGKNYKLLPAVIKAGQYKDSLSVLVMKTPALIIRRRLSDALRAFIGRPN